jgi:hypothetical protein
LEKEIEIVLKKYGRLFEQDLKGKVRKDKTIATSKALNSISSNAKGNTLSIEFSEVLGILSDGITVRKYPNQEAIIKWMKDKGIRPKNYKGVSSGASIENRYKSSAFLISRAIKEKGTIKRFGHKGTGVLDVLLPTSKLMTQLTDELSDVVGEEINLLFNKIEQINNI